MQINLITRLHYQFRSVHYVVDLKCTHMSDLSMQTSIDFTAVLPQLRIIFYSTQLNLSAER